MPENVEQLAWWGLNGAILIILWYIRNDFKRLNTSIEKNQRNNHKLYVFLMQINARCSVFHPDKQALTPPEWED